ncbi:MAG: RHS repeat-associated core domain-containing protein [Bacteroidota bacterium]
MERKYWRYGYQGEYAEKDKETQWNAFQLRQFDPVIGRWTTTDPYGQFPSPYLGMGNNPVSGVDPDGGVCPTCTGGDDVYSVGATVTNVNGSWKYLGGGNWQDLTAQGTSGGFMGGFWDFMNYMDEFVPKGAGQGMINSPIQFVLSGENGQIDLNAAKMNPDAKTFVVDMDELDMINDVLTKHNPNSKVHKLTLTQQRNQGKSNPVYVMNRAATEQLAASKHALAHQVRTKLPESSLAKPRYKTITDTVWIEFNGVRDTFNIRTYEVQDF